MNLLKKIKSFFSSKNSDTDQDYIFGIYVKDWRLPDENDKDYIERIKIKERMK